jgi:hypothetical protein
LNRDCKATILIPKEVRKRFVDYISTRETMVNKTNLNMRKSARDKVEFGPSFCLFGKNSFVIYFLMESFSEFGGNEYGICDFVAFNKKTNQVSEEIQSTKAYYEDFYWDDLKGDGKNELAYDSFWVNGSSSEEDKTFFEINDDCSIKQILSYMSKYNNGPNRIESKIIKKDKMTVLIKSTEYFDADDQKGIETIKRENLDF